MHFISVAVQLQLRRRRQRQRPTEHWTLIVGHKFYSKNETNARRN